MSARPWAYVGAVLGAAASIGGNVAHVWLAPVVEPGAVIAAAFWPVAVLVSVEILTRTPWRPGARWAAVRWLGVLPVALVAAMVSWVHLAGLLAHYGEPAAVVVVGPLAVDGLMVLSAGALLGGTPDRAPVGDRTPEPERSPAPVTDRSPEPERPVTTERAPVAVAAADRPRPVVTVPVPEPPAADRSAVREAFARSVADGEPLTVADIAERLGISPDAARALRNRWNRALSRENENAP